MLKKGVVCLFAFAALLLALPAAAQDSSRAEVFIGYSYLRGDYGDRHGDVLGGALVSGAWRFNDHFSAVGEASTHHDTIRGAHVDSNLFLFGPRVHILGQRRIAPFAHALFGFHQTQVGFPGVGLGGDDTGFALAAGGGLDLNLYRHFAVRALQADYILQDLNLPTRTGGVNQYTDNIRLASGIVFKW